MPFVISPDGGPPFSERFKDGFVVYPGPGSSPSFQQYVASALVGDLDAFFSLIVPDDLDVLAYKLANVAADFGHAWADEFIEDLLNGSSLHADDDLFAQGSAHFELGLAYLMGADGLPADPDKAKAHLEKSHEFEWPFHVQQGEILLEAARAILTAPQLTVFEEIYRPDEFDGPPPTEHA